MGRKFVVVCEGLLGLALLLPRPAVAAWPTDPLVNLPLCTAPGDQNSTKIISDGAGGTIVTWQDNRNGFPDIYAQHVLESGTVDPAWPANGCALCTAPGEQISPMLTADGAGGAIVTWIDNRSGRYNIYAQHVLASGVVDPAWPSDGAALCTAAGGQWNPAAVTDGAGGAFVVWFDGRNGPTDIYAQHVLASGTVDPAWPVDGLAVCTASADQAGQAMVSDGAGGALVAWHDFRGGQSAIYAQRLVAGGTDSAWPAGGRLLSVAANSRFYPQLALDGAGGAIVTWYDFRSSPTNSDIYAQHVLGSGVVDPAWPQNGAALCTAAGAQEYPSIVADGTGGAIAVWPDTRNGASNVDIYAQHVLANGTVDSKWPVDGRALCTATDRQEFPFIASDGAGGAIATWQDRRNGNLNCDIYAQRVLASGALDPAWPVDGLALSTAANGQELSKIVENGAGGAVVVWQDARSDENDMYAQRVTPNGQLGTNYALVTEVVGRGVVTRDPNFAHPPLGSSIILVAVPLPGDHFAGWSGDTTTVRDTLGIISDRPLHFTATFERDPAAAPSLSAVTDVPGDEGAHVRVQWQPSPIDTGDTPRWLRSYQIQRRELSPPSAPWGVIDSVAASSLPSYSHVVPTPADSTLADPAVFRYRVVAQANGYIAQWISNEADGYSVDNLAPAAPASVSGVIASGFASLSWPAVSAADLAGYRVFRGLEENLPTDAAHLIGTTTVTAFTDSPGHFAHYRVTAYDIHGNDSPGTLFVPFNPADVPGRPAPKVLSVGNPSPSPMARRMSMTLGLPRAMSATVDVLDSQGRLVRRLCEGERPAGWLTLSWDARDAGGHAAAAGMYFVRVQTPEGRSVRRLALIP